MACFHSFCSCNEENQCSILTTSILQCLLQRREYFWLQQWRIQEHFHPCIIRYRFCTVFLLFNNCSAFTANGSVFKLKIDHLPNGNQRVKSVSFEKHSSLLIRCFFHSSLNALLVLFTQNRMVATVLVYKLSQRYVVKAYKIILEQLSQSWQFSKTWQYMH